MKAGGCKFLDKKYEFNPVETFKLIDKIWIEGDWAH